MPISAECREWKERTGRNCIGTRLEVMKGQALKTRGGLKKEDLKYNRYERIVSKRASARSGMLTVWTRCVAKARRTLGLRGAVMINGNTQDGKDLYELACRFCAESGGCRTRARRDVRLPETRWSAHLSGEYGHPAASYYTPESDSDAE